MTTTNSITHLSTNSWCGSPRGQNPDRWNIGRDGGTLQQVQVRMVEALKCMNTFKRIVESPRDSRLSLSTTGPSYNIDDWKLSFSDPILGWRVQKPRTRESPPGCGKWRFLTRAYLCLLHSHSLFPIAALGGKVNSVRICDGHPIYHPRLHDVDRPSEPCIRSPVQGARSSGGQDTIPEFPQLSKVIGRT